MYEISVIYIDGKFVTPHGTEMFDLHNPTSGEVIGRVRLGDRVDAQAAIAAAKHAFPAWSRSSKAERIALLKRMHQEMLARSDELLEAILLEYGAPLSRSSWMAGHAAGSFLDAINALESYSFENQVGSATVVREPLGVAALITPWNSDAGFICTKLAYALAAGCTAVIKPSEMSATQTKIVMEALHAVGAPAGVFNIVTGRGDVVGAEFTTSPDVAKISFTGSTAVGKAIMRGAAETLKRVTLELGGKSPTIVLDDADFEKVLPIAVGVGLGNSGQACLNGTRILIPQSRKPEAIAVIQRLVEQEQSGDPRDPKTTIGPMVSRAQYERVQHYIREGIREGATLVTGGPGHPEGTVGFTVKPTVFADVRNDMVIAREEIFGPVLSVLTYADDEEAIRIANETPYGLYAYVLGQDKARATAVANRIEAGRVAVNGAPHDPKVPFGGFKQSGIGREYGVFGLESYTEPKAILSGLAA